MPESANRAAGVVYSATEPFTSEEYIKTLLETGTPVEVIEKFLNKKIEELEKTIEELRANNAEEDEIKAVEKDLKKHKKIKKTVAKRAELAAKDKELKTTIEKTKKCYEDTLACADKILEFISNLDVENLGNINTQKDKLHVLIDGDGKTEVGFKKLLSSQIGLKNKTIEILDAIKNLKVDYKVYEEYQKLVPVFAGKTREIVKNKYKETLTKITDLEEMKKNSSYLNDQKKYDALITELKRVNEEVLPSLLEDPKQMEIIKEEVAKELNIPYTPTKPENPIDVGNGTPGNDGGSDGDNDDDLSKGGNNGQPAATGDDKPVPPITSPDETEFKKAKQEYLSVIESINTAVEHLNAINQEQDAFAMNPEFNYERMIEKEKEATKICNRITDFKNILLDLEYNNYVNNHIMLNLDPEVKEAKIKNADYNGELEVFVSLHNEVIEGCYKELHQIANQDDYATREDLKERSKLLLKVIDTQHLIINRRLLTERRKDKNFDMISFMKAHRVDPKKFANEPVEKIDDIKKPEPKEEPTEPKVDEQAIIKTIEQQLLVYQQDLVEALSQKFALEVTPADDAFIKLENEHIDKLFKKADDSITKYIDGTELSAETKAKMHDKAASFREKTIKDFEEVAKKDKAYYELRVAYKKDVEVLIIQSNELIQMSTTTISSEEYKNKKAKFHAGVAALKEKYKDLEFKLSKDALTERAVISIHDQYKNERMYKVLRVMTPELEKSIGKTPKVKIKTTGLNLGNRTQITDRDKAIIDTFQKVDISLLKNSIKVEYTKTMIEELKTLKVKLEISAAANNEGKITVTEGIESKNGEKEYRYIKNPNEVSEAKIVYKDMETDEEIMSYDILSDEDITNVISERAKSR